MGNMCCLLCHSEIWIGAVKLFLALPCVLLAHEIPVLKITVLWLLTLLNLPAALGSLGMIWELCVCVSLCVYVYVDNFVLI